MKQIIFLTRGVLSTVGMYELTRKINSGNEGAKIVRPFDSPNVGRQASFAIGEHNREL